MSEQVESELTKAMDACYRAGVTLRTFTCEVRRLQRQQPTAEREAAIELALKRLVIAWDAEQDLEFDEAMNAARDLLGFKLADEGIPT